MAPIDGRRVNMLNDERIHVLIAHDNPLIAAGLEAAFGARQDFYIVGRRESDDVSPLDAATVAVTDYEGGTRWLAAQRGSGCRVLILTDDDGEVSIRRAVDLGISGYLPLSSGVESVVHAVRCIHNGGMAIESNIMSKMAMSLRSRGLTQREVEVLRLIMQGLRDKVIAGRLEHSVETTKSHVKAILMKLGASSRVEAVAIARRRGLVSEKSLAPSGSGQKGAGSPQIFAEQQR
jgi:DNA-binding NarL/FixJ family response regulator